MAAAKTGPVESITAAMISDLPDPVQNWLMVSGVVGREPVRTVRLRQEVHLKMKPEQKDWTDARAEQYYSTDPPAFIWHVDMEMLPLIGVQGRDKFVGGRGSMLIKLLSLIPIVDESDNEKLNTGALQRYLGEIVWFPSAALSPYITWEPLDAFSARATMTYSGTTGSGTFFFNKKGDFEKFSALRWMGSGDEASQHEWVITVEAYRTMDGIRIPSACRATWKLPDGDWTWLELEITEITYNTAAGK
jgi:hypothetical protein